LKEKYEVLEDSSETLRIRLKKSAAGVGDLVLIFSKYPNGNIKNLEAWIIDDGNDETLFSFDPKSMSINDKSKIPAGIFEQKNNR
jgi:hypothetical protein